MQTEETTSTSVVCKIPLLARRTRPSARPSARATIGYLVYNYQCTCCCARVVQTLSQIRYYLDRARPRTTDKTKATISIVCYCNCIQDTLSSRLAHDGCIAFRPSVHASKGIVHIKSDKPTGRFNHCATCLKSRNSLLSNWPGSPIGTIRLTAGRQGPQRWAMCHRGLGKLAIIHKL